MTSDAELCHVLARTTLASPPEYEYRVTSAGRRWYWTQESQHEPGTVDVIGCMLVRDVCNMHGVYACTFPYCDVRLRWFLSEDVVRALHDMIRGCARDEARCPNCAEMRIAVQDIEAFWRRALDAGRVERRARA